MDLYLYAHGSAPPLTPFHERKSMRTLCLSFSRPTRSCLAETFLTYSPRVHYRPPGLIFIDVESTAHLFGGESQMIKEVRALAKDLFSDLQAGISDTPWTSQVLARNEPFTILSPQSEDEYLDRLPVHHLEHLEGLVAWRSRSDILSIIDFFQQLGFRQLQDVRQIEISKLRERWGDLGVLIWRRLHGQDKQVISPLLSREALTEYVHFDFAVSMLPFLLHSSDSALRSLFLRLQGRGEFARKLLFHIYCEYDDQYHLLEMTPSSPSRNKDLFMNLVEHRLGQVDLNNPVREMVIEVVSCPESIRQLDFWQPRESDQDKWQSLISLFQQADVTSGFLHSRHSILPEDSWGLSPEILQSTDDEDVQIQIGDSIQIKPSHSHTLSDAPRPTSILNQPEPLSRADMKKFRFINHLPVERLEDSWWEDSRGRDYHVALSQNGQMAWIFYDHIENRYYLQGYFD